MVLNCAYCGEAFTSSTEDVNAPWPLCCRCAGPVNGTPPSHNGERITPLYIPRPDPEAPADDDGRDD